MRLERLAWPVGLGAGVGLLVFLLEHGLKRLLLVPHVIVLLPAALLVVQNGSRAAADSRTVAR